MRLARLRGERELAECVCMMSKGSVCCEHGKTRVNMMLSRLGGDVRLALDSR